MSMWIVAYQNVGGHTISSTRQHKLLNNCFKSSVEKEMTKIFLNKKAIKERVINNHYSCSTYDGFGFCFSSHSRSGSSLRAENVPPQWSWIYMDTSIILKKQSLNPLPSLASFVPSFLTLNYWGVAPKQVNEHILWDYGYLGNGLSILDHFNHAHALSRCYATVGNDV